MKLLNVMAGTLALQMTGCEHLPSFSRSGEVRDIAITDRLLGVTIQVNAGDEIRWTNKLMMPMRVTLLDYVLDKLSCRRNFSGHYYSGAEANLRPNESASLCFLESTYVKYVVRMTSLFSGGEASNAGAIKVGDTDVDRPSVREVPNAVLSGDKVIP